MLICEKKQSNFSDFSVTNIKLSGNYLILCHDTVATSVVDSASTTNVSNMNITATVTATSTAIKLNITVNFIS